MSKLTLILKLPLRLLIIATLIGGYYAAYTNLITWGATIFITGIIILYILGIFLEKKPKDVVLEGEEIE